MGSCVSSHQKSSPPSASMKVKQVLLFGSSSDDIIKPPIINNNGSAPSFRDFGSKEETFFDSQVWLESDCDDDFMSFNGGNDKPPISSQHQPSPNGSEKKMRLSDLFNDSQRVNYDSEFEEAGEAANKNGVNSKVKSPLVHGVEVMANGGNGLKTKRERFGRSVQNCFPSLISSRSSSTNGLWKEDDESGPGPEPKPQPCCGMMSDP